MKNRAKKYYVLANEYLEATKVLLNTIIENENNSCGIGNSEEEALIDLEKNIKKSDAYLLIPAMFDGIQTVELFIKALLLLNGKCVPYNHEVDGMMKQLKELYGEQSEIFRALHDFYKNQIEILKSFKKTNNITNLTDLYEALRYPENNSKVYEYYDLKYKGKKVLKQYEKMLNKIEIIRSEVFKIFAKPK